MVKDRAIIIHAFITRASNDTESEALAVTWAAW